MKRDLLETLTQAAMEDSVRVVLFVGSGRAFSAGDDISGQDKGRRGEALVPDIHRGHDNVLGTINGLRKISQPINTAIRGMDKLTVAAMNGVAVQTGFSLALSCDFRIASTAARMGSGTLRFGLLPDEGGHYLLLQMMGLPKTMDFLMRSRLVEAAEALELGLVHEVVEPDELMPRAMDLARELANGPQVAMRLLKRSLYKRRGPDLGAVARGHRGPDADGRPSPGLPRGRRRLPREAEAALQRMAGGVSRPTGR